MSLLDRRVQLMWNGKTVLMGASTSAVAYTVAAEHMRQFAGEEWRRWNRTNVLEARLLDRITRGERIVLEFLDETGHAMALIEAL